MNRVALSIVLSALLASACARPPAPAVEEPLKRGEYLVSVLGCDDCHSPKVMGANGPELDPARRLSGHRAEPVLPPPPSLSYGPWNTVTNTELTALSGPWGISYATNLTPDVNTGIGIWTEEMFVKMIRTGKHMGQSRPVLPPMPIQIYKNLSDADLKAVFAYLRSLPPITNQVPDAVIAPPPGS